MHEHICGSPEELLHSWEWWRIPIIQVTGRLGSEDGLRLGALLVAHLCRSGVHTKPCVDMVSLAEVGVPRLTKEGRKGPGRKRSRQNSPRGAVVG